MPTRLHPRGFSVLDRPVGGFCPARRSRVKRDRKRVSPALYSLGSINADFQARIDRAPDTGRTLIGKDFLRLSGGKVLRDRRDEKRASIRMRNCRRRRDERRG